MFEFVDRYGKIKIGSKIRIKSSFFSGNRAIPTAFFEWIRRYGNIFTVNTIYKIADTAMISVEEMKGHLEYDQVSLKNRKVINWHRI